MMQLSRTRRCWQWVAAAVLWTSACAQPAGPGDWDVLPSAPLADLPNNLPSSPTLIKSLGDSAEFVTRWKVPATAAGWNLRRPVVDRAFRRAIGLETLPERTPLKARIVARHEFAGYSVENLIFESRPGFPVTANVYVPAGAEGGRRPAIVSPIGHFLTPGKTAPDVQARCIQLSKLGFIVLVYDAIGQGERMVPGNIHHDAGYALLPLGETIAGWMVWDSMRALDYLLTRPDVDGERIGITGNSGGGLNTLFTAALDHRFRAATIVGFTFEFNNWIKYGGAHCTCTHLPGVFREMEWFEIAGLIAPAAVQMIQGGNDAIFPVSGARWAGRGVLQVYDLAGHAGLASFVELPGMPHAYSRPYREQMYGWMCRHLLGTGRGEPRTEDEIQTLPELDRRLICDPDHSQLAGAMTVLDYARRRGMELSSNLSQTNTSRPDGPAHSWAKELTAPPEQQPHFLSARSARPKPVPAGTVEKLSFDSEDGQRIPGILWLPATLTSASQAILIADDRGKSAVAESGLIAPLMAAGHVVLAVDLRGRGETLGRYSANYDTSFRLVANQVLFGKPLAGRRGYDLIRSVDFLRSRPGMESKPVTLVGLGDDALPALLAAAADSRIVRLVMAGYVQSFVSQMQARIPPAPGKMGDAWNDPQLQARLKSRDYEIQFGSVIPSALQTADLPQLISLVLPRPVMLCQARDFSLVDAELSASCLKRLSQTTQGRLFRYIPGDPLEAATLLEWLKTNPAP